MPPLRSRPPGPRRGGRPPAQAPRPAARAPAPRPVGGQRPHVATASAAADGQRKAMAAGMVGLLFLSLGAILFVMYQVFLGGGADPPVARTRPFAIPAGALQFTSLADFERAQLRSGQLFAVTIPEAELNTRIAEAIVKQPDLPFRDVKATLLEERADFNGTVQAAGLSLSPTIGMTFRAENGLIRHSIESIYVGPLPVPGFASSAVSDTVARQLEQQKMTEKFTVEDVQIRTGLVMFYGRWK